MNGMGTDWLAPLFWHSFERAWEGEEAFLESAGCFGRWDSDCGL
jgi:hypothetical protein